MTGAALASVICYRVYPERIVIRVPANLDCELGPDIGKVSCFIAESR
jgi:hypothetical protein